MVRAISRLLVVLSLAEVLIDEEPVL